VSRCSPTKALNLLRREFSAMAAARMLTNAVHDNVCRLYCDGKVVPAHFRVRLMVEPHCDSDGRWTARIVSAVGEAWEKPDKPVYKWGTKDELEAAPYRWEFDLDEVAALLPVRRGVKGVNWEIHATLEMEHLGHKAVLDMHNSGQLLKHLKRVLRRDVKFVPKDDKALPKVIRAFLHGVN
jgi:hypothetical protein